MAAPLSFFYSFRIKFYFSLFLQAYLDTGNSIFRLSWRIDDSKILDSLSIHTNQALLPFIVEFVDSWAKEQNCTTAEAHRQMSDKVCYLHILKKTDRPFHNSRASKSID